MQRNKTVARTRKKNSTETFPEEAQTLSQLSYMFKELRETLGKELKESRKMSYEQNANVSKEIKNL